jgi:hypothetical protein
MRAGYGSGTFRYGIIIAEKVATQTSTAKL